MIERLQRLAHRISQELTDLEVTVNRAQRAIISARDETRDQDLFLDAAALNLHDFYTGVERIFSHIAGDIDGKIPSGNAWHRELLNQMSREIPGIRPAVVSQQSSYFSYELLSFRHVVRNIYAFEFDPERIGPLVDKLGIGFEQLREDVLAFVEFLRDLAREELE